MSNKDVININPQDYSHHTFMSYGEALEAMRRGFVVCRNTWLNYSKFALYKCIFITDHSYVPYAAFKPITRKALEKAFPDTYTVPSGSNVSSTQIFEIENQKIRINDHIDAICSNSTVQVGWFPSQEDMLATDWKVL